MRICLVAEGSYPYVTGGVSSWIQMLITSMPEHEFIVYAIGASKKEKGKFKYTLPDNLIEVKEVFFDAFLESNGIPGKRYKIKNEEKEAVSNLLMGKETNWNLIFEFILSEKFQVTSDFFMSKDFFDILTEAYEDRYYHTPFTEFFWTLRSMFLPLFELIKQGAPKADLYHSVSTGYAGILGSLGGYLYKKPYILTEHGIYTREREEEIIKADWVKGYFKDMWIRYFYSLSSCSYFYADQIITLFNKNREIQVELGCREDKIKIIPNGVEIEDFKDIPQRDVNETTVNIGAIVRLVPIKDIKTMIQSFSIVKGQVPHAKFYIMGPVEENLEYYEECEQLVESLQLKDLIFTGSVNIKEYIGKMDLLVLTSISEGQPLAILEGMACRRPFVSTNVGSCKELLYGLDDCYGKAGIVVSIMDYEQIGKAIINLCRNQEMRLKMGLNAFERVSNCYTKKSFVDKYKSLYNKFKGA